MIVTGRIFLRGREQIDPTLHFRRKSACPGKRYGRLNPAIMRHGKWFYSLPARAVGCPSPAAAIRQQNRADRGRISSNAIVIWVGIDHSQDIRVLIRNVGIIAATPLRAPIYSVCARRSRNESDNLVCRRVNDCDVIR